MDPTTTKRSTRHLSREQALPNSTRRLARAAQRNKTEDVPLTTTTATPNSHRRRNSDAEKRYYRGATEDLIDNLKDAHVRSSRRSRSERHVMDSSHIDSKEQQQQRETTKSKSAAAITTTTRDRKEERGKKREKEKKLKEIHDLIRDAKGEKRQSGTRSRRHNDDERRRDVVKEEEKEYSSLRKYQEEGNGDSIDGADELSDGLDRDYQQKDVEDFAPEEAEASDDNDDFEPEEIDETNYNHTTYYDEEGRVISDKYGLSDSDLRHLTEGDADEDSESEYVRPAHSDLASEYEASVMTDRVSKASVNPRSNSPEPNPYSRDSIEDMAGMVCRQISSDPPTHAEEKKFHGSSMEPNEEIGSVYQRELELDAPPSPKGPELRRNNNNDNHHHHRDSRKPYTNYTLDNETRDQYKNQAIIPIEDGVRRMKVQQDPPESNRGLDVPAPRGPRVRTSKTSKDKKKQEEKKKPQPELKSILRRKGSPPVVSYFGKPVQFDEEVSSGSEPEVTETKQGRVRVTMAEDDKSKSSSGLRSGKYANINEEARKLSKESDDASQQDSISIESPSDSDSEEGTIQTITDNTDDRFDRSKTYYLRTSDLGLTQDTIFAEQFLDNPKSKAEPHYHHPSPHPPPGIQFHVDENYLAVNDGKGGYSPVAPQAVDALVAIGYRTACDPVMWTPSSKTRKYMTERGLRFADVPLPGPLDEGEGGPDDSTCMVWTGKFSHKYYGHDLLAIRSQGVVNMSAEDLVDLLMDSDRIQEYNKSSNGRTDEIVLSDGTNLDNCPFSGRRKKKLTGVVMDNTRIVDGVAIVDSQSEDERSEDTEEFDDDGNRSYSSSSSRKKESSFVGVTKVVRSVNVIPLVKKKMDFVTLVHCRALTDDQGGNGYIIVGRNVYPADDAEKTGKGIIRSEVMLNVHIIRKFKPQKKGVSGKKSKGDSRSVVSSASGKAASARELSNRCLMINVSHLKSPMIPNIMAKKMGCAAAASFINDIRGLTSWP